MIANALTDFARQLGFEGFRWPDEGYAAFAFEQRGTLYLTETEQTLLVTLVQSIPHQARDAELLKRALRLCHYRENWPHPVQTALREDWQLLFMARLPLAEVTPAELNQTLELLTRLHARVRD